MFQSIFLDKETHRTFCILLFNIFTLFFHSATLNIYLNAATDTDSFVFLTLEVCSDAIFRIQPTALPKPQPLPALLGDSVASSPNPEVELGVGVRGGVSGMWTSSLCVFQVKVKLGVDSGVSGRSFSFSFLWYHRFRPNGRLVHLRSGISLTNQGGDGLNPGN